MPNWSPRPPRTSQNAPRKRPRGARGWLNWVFGTHMPPRPRHDSKNLHQDTKMMPKTSSKAPKPTQKPPPSYLNDAKNDHQNQNRTLPSCSEDCTQDYTCRNTIPSSLARNVVFNWVLVSLFRSATDLALATTLGLPTFSLSRPSATQENALEAEKRRRMFPLTLARTNLTEARHALQILTKVKPCLSAKHTRTFCHYTLIANRRKTTVPNC